MTLFVSDMKDSFQRVQEALTRLMGKDFTRAKCADWLRLIDCYRLFEYEDDQRFELLSKIVQKKDYVSFQTLLKLAKWKTGNRTKKLLEGSKNETESISKEALQMINKDESTDGFVTYVKANAKLTELEGVGIPTASVILTAYKPDVLGVIDRLAYSLLFPDESEHEISTQDQWRKYLEMLHKIRRGIKEECQVGVGCRDIEAAAWFLKRRRKQATITEETTYEPTSESVCEQA
jgi:hypothetical protein